MHFSNQCDIYKEIVVIVWLVSVNHFCQKVVHINQSDNRYNLHLLQELY